MQNAFTFAKKLGCKKHLYSKKKKKKEKNRKKERRKEKMSEDNYTLKRTLRIHLRHASQLNAMNARDKLAINYGDPVPAQN